MKKTIFLLMLLVTASAYAQDSTLVEQYCELVSQPRALSNKVTIDVNFGEERKFFSGDKRLRDEVTGKVKKFNSLVDALNYMGAQGWKLVNAFPITVGTTAQVYHFYFRKLFSKEEVDRAEN